MPLRYYECSKCDHTFSVFQSLHAKLKKRCPKCKGKIYQDLTGISTSVKQYNTVGSVAERNTKELGTYGRDAKEQELQQENEKLRKKKDSILENRGIKTIKGNKTSGVTEKAVKLVESGDKKAIKRYIMTGK